METSNIIDSLVATYRELNTRFRMLEGTPESMEIVRRMRDDEVAFSQALKDRITGIPTQKGEETEVVDGSERSFAQVISQFGSVRATTLNSLKGLESDSEWDQPGDDGKSIRQHTEDLVRSDANQLERLGQILGA